MIVKLGNHLALFHPVAFPHGHRLHFAADFSAQIAFVAFESSAQLNGAVVRPGQPVANAKPGGDNQQPQRNRPPQFLLQAALLSESGRFPALAQLFFRALPQRVWRLLEEYFEAHPELNHTNPEATARIFMGTLMSYVLTQKLLHGQEILPMKQEVMIDSLLELIIR
ncbi:TetR/AcrR family transcriptional regulator C-terminal domain-containing protein [Leptolyngbya sp. BC1307]|uniref:TetR/AcrR family transcriptional regulator C-terminal domain-containing protein n=1 Tax=Leptolyngbya sp. BC1307 TaxID=2029589 RepID=UPI001F0B3DC8|nr:TetR/AcrR family transcriptional regulator C-terminal domain-containing protein [Leptolyngbya sp. BC1307]